MLLIILNLWISCAPERATRMPPSDVRHDARHAWRKTSRHAYMKGADAALPRRTLENMQRILTTRGRLLATASPRP